MQKIHVFAIALAASLTTLSLLLAVSLYLSATAPPYSSSWMQQMWNGMGMNGMMGESNGSYSSIGPSYLWIIPAALVGIVVVSIIGVGFYFAFPQIRTVTQTPGTNTKERFPANPRNANATAVNSGAYSTPYESVSKTLTPEERKVLNVLVAHQGTYLQKYIRKEAGLSRLKTHRIIARFAQRGMVTLKQSGNTNEISLADWLKDSKAQNHA